MENHKKTIIKGLIENGNIKEALDSFDQFSSDNKFLNDNLIKLKARYQINKKHELNATLDSKEISIENNKIVSAVLELLNPDDKAVVNRVGNKKSTNELKTLLIFLFLFFGSIFLLFTFLFYPRNKIILGKVTSFQDGLEIAIEGCNVKILNLSQQGISTKTNEAGIFNLNVVGQNIQDLEFGLNHIDYENYTEVIRIDFRVFKDTIFSKEFNLNSKER